MGAGIEIHVATHKQTGFPLDPGYVPIHAGRGIAEVDLGIRGDDTGDNISSRNPHFCELTALYWIWKNSDAAIKGLVHYRRHFIPKARMAPIGLIGVAASDDFDEFSDGYDMILPDKITLTDPGSGAPQTVERQYDATAVGFDLVLTRAVLEEFHAPYIPYWDFVMRNCKLHPYNIMIARAEVFDAYCAWLFDILFRLEPQIPFRDYPPYEARVFGFLAERLLNVWVGRHRTSCRVAFRPVGMLP
ncbi:DUF4422 domain-containing protein [Rhodobacter maris]|uniref:Uncharacterized protein DUF4422 n=1 Tax=Rhodobacter maris TaxID=446682 RepID=A0A285RVW1_9RHOB|nr:DUF4422 domain-containing protein [Rhodobacter maris]SOB98662.1 uncharacterized protein DUF4422 [Rhodobacter maris]